MVSLIDGDILVYECGFSSDSNAKKKALEAGADIEEAKSAHEPIEYCLQNVKEKIREIETTVESDDKKVYLTGKDNFRDKLLPEYKANRDPSHKPFWYKEIKEFLIDVYDAEVVDGMEADDKLGIVQCGSGEWTCICSKDKDLDCVPGFHYNWSPSRYDKGVYYIEEVDALRFFYTQVLTGDTTDNIPGLKKSIGKVATKKKKDVIQELEEEIDMYNWVKECYGDFDFTHIAQCLWILREEGKLWEAPDNG